MTSQEIRRKKIESAILRVSPSLEGTKLLQEFVKELYPICRRRKPIHVHHHTKEVIRERRQEAVFEGGLWV